MAPQNQEDAANGKRIQEARMRIRALGRAK
jgi:hypothetical protein